MAIPYSPPNITVTETVDPSVSPLIAPPALLALVGVASGAITRSDVITLSGDGVNQAGEDAIPLPGVPNGAVVESVLKVEDSAYNLDTVYVEDDDYIVTNAGAAQSDSVNAATITRVHEDDDGEIPQGTAPDYEHSVLVTYTYIPEDYFSPILLEDMASITARFGPASTDPIATNSPAVVNSPLTFAAEIAFENGASQIVCQPLFKVDGSARVSPDASEASTAATTWSPTFEALRENTDANLIVAVSGQSADVSNAEQKAIAQTLQDHIKYLKSEEQEYAIGLFGYDGTSSVSVTQTTLQTDAVAISLRHGGEVTQQMVMVSPAKFLRPSRSGGLMVGGQYAAAAIGGMIASRAVYQPLTRQALSGFSQLGEVRTKSGKNADAAVGLMVIEDKDDLVQVRHAVTMDTTSTPARELSVVRAKHRVIESIRQTIDDQIIGQVVADGDAALVVRSAIIGVLDQLRSERDIVSYSDVQSRVASLDPTTIEVRFSYAPAFPVNYVNVVFSLDLSGGNVEATEV